MFFFPCLTHSFNIKSTSSFILPSVTGISFSFLLYIIFSISFSSQKIFLCVDTGIPVCPSLPYLWVACWITCPGVLAPCSLFSWPPLPLLYLCWLSVRLTGVKERTRWSNLSAFHLSRWRTAARTIVSLTLQVWCITCTFIFWFDFTGVINHNRADIQNSLTIESVILQEIMIE